MQQGRENRGASQFDPVWDFSGGLAQAVIERDRRREHLYVDKSGRMDKLTQCNH